MLPRLPMLTIKNRCAVFAAVVVLLAGCMPPGPRALLEGKRLLERGKYAEAIERFQTATSLLATNAQAWQAWNYLGLACQYVEPGFSRGAIQPGLPVVVTEQA